MIKFKQLFFQQFSIKQVIFISIIYYFCGIMLNKYLYLDGISVCREFCKKKNRIIEIKKDDFFFRQGKISMYVGYVQAGAFRYMNYTSAGKTQIVGYSFQNDFVTDYSTFLNQTTAIVHAQAIEDSLVYAITWDELNEFFNNNPDIHFRSKVAESLFADIYDRFISLYCDTPKERYLRLIEQHPEMLNMVSLKEIASFIGITPETLSRIRKSIASSDVENH